MYSLEIELCIENKESLVVFCQKNLFSEECLKEALKWRLRPFQKSVKIIYIYIEPEVCKDSAISNNANNPDNLNKFWRTRNGFHVLPGGAGSIPAGTRMVCSISVCDFKQTIRQKGQRPSCPNHGILLIPETQAS